MARSNYPWQRFWSARTGDVILSDGGYLVDPQGEYGRYFNPDVLPLESVDSIPCLVLLGEPGIGKSYALLAERERIQDLCARSGDRILALDLRAFSSEERLVKKIFDSAEFQAWRTGTHRLHLFLDSLDECLLRIDSMAALLLDELQQDTERMSRLSLRIACRTAEWPAALLEEGLRQLWGEDSFGVCELVPLRRADVAAAARVNALDPAPFFEEIDRTNAVPLAIKPVTLDLLIRMYRDRGSLPRTQVELYREGLRLLCEETNESYGRAARLRAGATLTGSQRLAVAGRIAAVMIFANRYAVWTAVDRGDVPPEDITIAQLSGGREVANGDAFTVDEEAIRETLRCGLFSSRGTNRLSWAHQTYAEFLAADYLGRREMSLPQQLGLLVHTDDPEGKLVPQLHETAAWAASMDLDVFRAIVDADPDVLLRSDVATVDADDRERLVGALLRLIDEDRLFTRDLGRHQLYRKLVHAGLADQLRPYIVDATKGNLVRFEAIDIAEACVIQEVLGDLVNLALDESQSVPVRACAASTIAEIGDDGERVRLRPLALGLAGDDPDDELKGAGLRAVWPGQLSAEELFLALTLPKRSDLIGGYALFLSRKLVENLEFADLPLALSWVEQQETRRRMPHQLAEIADSIMLRAWSHLDQPVVLDAFVRVALKRILAHDALAGDLRNEQQFSECVLQGEVERRRVLLALLPLLPDRERDWVRLVYSATPLFVNADLPWAIEQLRAAQVEQQKCLWSRLIGRVFNLSDPVQVDAVLTACEDETALAQEFAWLITPIRLDSDQARAYKEEYQALQQRGIGAADSHPFPTEELQHWLGRAESGVMFPALWNILVELSFDPATKQTRYLLDADVSSWTGWARIDPATRSRVVSAARQYLMGQEPSLGSWLASDECSYADLAAFKALHLLCRETPDSVESLPDVVWQNWVPIVLAYPTNSASTAEKVQQVLVKVACQRAPAETRAALWQLIDKESAQRGQIFLVRKLALCWDEPLAVDILAKAQDPSLTPAAMGDLLEELIKHDVAGATAFAESLLALPLPVVGADRERTLVAARVLLAQAEGAGWNKIWAILQCDPVFGRSFVEWVAHSARWGAGNLRQLTEDELADLFVWLVRQYPPSEDPQFDGVHSVEPRESVGRWRDSVLEELKARGNQGAIAAIRRLVRELPELPYLKWSLLMAQATTRRRTWVPPSPAEILALAADRQKRLVQDGQQLLAVLIESLQRLQVKLHGETPAVAGVWNEWKQEGKTLHRPKDEERLSDFVKLHLDEDLRDRGIVVNREVQIRRGEGGVSGERTDLHVDAIRRTGLGNDDCDIITVIIEVKGNWHRELLTAMETQLVDRYLRDNQTQHGLYLVGWFTCPQWDSTDSRCRAVPDMTISEAREYFDRLADTLTNDDRRIVTVVLDTGLRS